MKKLLRGFVVCLPLLIGSDAANDNVCTQSNLSNLQEELP
jgi:hypothetical protein